MSNLVVNIYSFVFAVILADSSSASTVNESSCSSIPAPFQEICSNFPIIGSVFWGIYDYCRGSRCDRCFYRKAQDYNRKPPINK